MSIEDQARDPKLVDGAISFSSCVPKLLVALRAHMHIALV